MSEHWPPFGSDPSNAETQPSGSSSANGADPGVAIADPESASDEQVATHDGPDTESPAAVGQADETPATAEQTDEAPVGEQADAASESPTTDDIAATAVEPAATDDGSTSTSDEVAAAATSDEGATASGDEGSVFVAQLVQAMQTTAALERVRVGEDIERRRQAHIDLVRSRQRAEADRMRDLAGDDLKSIQEWADGEIGRIQGERERRATELQKDLETSLVEHGAKIDREIEGVEMAIATYRAHVDAFFESLDRETDPILIAQQAASRPMFPSLDALVETVSAAPAEAAETAEPAAAEKPSSDAEPAPTGDASSGTATPSEGASEPPWVAVMDPEAEAAPVESWTAPADPTPAPAATGASEEADQGGTAGEPGETVTVPVGQINDGNTSLFESISVLRPMAWLRREANGGEHVNREG
ncbi:MAG TPA: hypothetical protein VE640_03350 [Candidatus Bathyarchaeia archaeon]|jgi:hypothetical protein|nr:hypothetical protein [Candidatus Bathyarchaeia archaeon]